MSEEQVTKSPTETGSEDLYSKNVAAFVAEAESNAESALRRFGMVVWHSVTPETSLQIRADLGLDMKTAGEAYVRGTLAAQAGEYEKAVSELRSALKRDPDHGLAAFNLAFCLEKLKRFKDSREVYEQYLEILDRASGRVDLRNAADGDLAEEKARVREHIETIGK